jgi:hypothetical protein
MFKQDFQCLFAAVRPHQAYLKLSQQGEQTGLRVGLGIDQQYDLPDCRLCRLGE